MKKNTDDIKYMSIFKDGEDYVCAEIETEYCIDTHIHDFYEIDIIQRGRGAAVINDTQRCLSKGDILVIPPHIKHSFNGSSDVIQIFVTSYFLVENADFLSLLSGYRRFFSGETVLLQKPSERLGNDEIDSIKSNSEKLMECEKMSDRFREAMKKAIFFLMITELLSFIYDGTELDEADAFNEEAVVKSIEFIKNRYNEKITVNDLAAVSNMSVSAYMRNFVRLFDITPYEYVNMYRIKNSKKLLEETNLSISNIAQSCGFYDSSHFTRFFKKYERITPSQYKKQWSHKAAF